MTRVVLATNSNDRGSTSRTLEAWARLLPAQDILPTVTVGGRGHLLSALVAAEVPAHVRRLSVTPGMAGAFSFAARVGALAATALKAGAALLHVNEHDSHPVAAYAASLARIPIVTHVRFRPGAEYCRWLFKPGRRPNLLLFTSQTQMVDSAAALEPVVPREHWLVLPNGLDFSVFGQDASHRMKLRSDWGLSAETIAVGMACAISRRKRVDHFIRLISRLRSAGVPARGFVAGRAHFQGDEGLLTNLRELATELGVGDHVVFLGYVEPVEPLYHAWDLCVSTSEYETFGMAVLEAMACSCPVVTYPGGSIAEIVGTAAAVIPDADEDALFDECSRLAHDGDARRALGRHGRHHAQSNYDIRLIVPRLANAYRAVLENNGR